MAPNDVSIFGLSDSMEKSFLSRLLVPQATHMHISCNHKIQCPYLQQPATFPYPEPDASSPRPPIPFLCQPHYKYPPIHTLSVLPVSQPNPQRLLLSIIRTTSPHPPLPPRLLHPTNIWQHKSRSSSLCSFLQSPATFSHLCPHVFLSSLFSNTLTSVLPTIEK
jgi:hypothetical protein